MPGPLLAVTIDESIRRGPKAGPLIVAGHAILEAALVAALAFGLVSFLKSDVVIAAISFAGGAVMRAGHQGFQRNVAVAQKNTKL